MRLLPEDWIVSVNPGHDGAITLLKNGVLVLSSETEHDSRPRHWPVNAYHLIDSLKRIDRAPAVLALSGWPKGYPHQSATSRYYGVGKGAQQISEINFCGSDTKLFESTHERAHIFLTYGLSPFKQGEPCYVLTWEGNIGSFYELDQHLEIVQHGPVVRFPGYKYSFLYDLADPEVKSGTWRLDNSGKLMALAGFARKRKVTELEEKVIAIILDRVFPPAASKEEFLNTGYANCGVTDPRFCDLVAHFSDKLFETFYEYARAHLQKQYPLLISGGCGLNCEWNSRWRDCGLFSDIFVPPVTNDSGVAIGTAIEAQFAMSGNAKVSWSVYSGEDFVIDYIDDGFIEHSATAEEVAKLLNSNAVVAWVKGRCEIGPRALGHRSILAAPFSRTTTERLNSIKQREEYRPIAPVCLEEDSRELFGVVRSSPYMLYFSKVRDKCLEAVTHADGSARVQTIRRCEDASLYDLLVAFKRVSGYGVLCNTSLNFKGKGFINRSSDLFAFALAHGIDGVVIESRLYLRKKVSFDTNRPPSSGVGVC